MAGSRGTALVTGTSAGIGEVYARRLAALGHDLVLIARREERLHALAEKLTAAHGIRAEVMRADLTTDVDIHRVAERAAGEDITLVINNAGVGGYGPFAQVEPAVLEGLAHLHILAPLLATRAALPGMLSRGRGAVINVASLLAFSGALPPVPLPHRATYAGAKAFLVHFTRTLAGELRDTPVRAQVVCPGMTATEFNGGYVGAMPPEDVVTASLLALERNETVCVPGLEAEEALAALAQAEAGMFRGNKNTLARRYQTPPAS
ncbi:SDR family NAD(P)-dependent oxidoreductase [Corallococcus praedator]|uniref:SDR family NAD(P)-dependent oxidoreductase n=1 Tax=Corallococcus praedator TaxID=2316724 RepID=A0ABX9QA16_9BACT|nr:MULTISPECIES: SDR family NAD(P)-dependent oxidoreductase [Corallococcus]RKH23136.1 SDR family NAD(P)-dependent oxidoreductase [Corallococcus sp. CA031C]RKH97424.1 SDR family NAD(P)-dependent oxidoreductase [Corallococcus praedator]